MKIRSRIVEHGFKWGGGLMLGITFNYPIPIWTKEDVVKHLLTLKVHLIVVTLQIAVTI